MDPFTISAIIGGGVALASSVGSHIANRRAQKKSMREQNSLNRENWQMENAYNNPSAQMSRLRAAGLNPNLIYQDGAPVAAGSIESPQFGSNVADYSEVARFGSQLAELQIQRDQVDSNIALNQTLAAYNFERARGEDYLNENRRADSFYADEKAYQDFIARDWQNRLAHKTYDHLIEQIEQTKANTKLLKEQKRFTSKQVDHIQKQMDMLSTQEWQIVYQTMLNQISVDADVSLKQKMIEQIDSTLATMQQERNIRAWIEDRMLRQKSLMTSDNPLDRFMGTLLQSLKNVTDIIPLGFHN